MQAESKLFFLKEVMLHIKLKGMEHRAPCRLKSCPYTHPPTPYGVKTFFSLKEVMLHIKLKGRGHKTPCKHIFCTYTHPWPLGLGQKVQTFFSEKSHVAYQIKWDVA